MTVTTKGPGKLIKKTTAEAGDTYSLSVTDPGPPAVEEITELTPEPLDGRVHKEMEALYQAGDGTVSVTVDSGAPNTPTSVSSQKPK